MPLIKKRDVEMYLAARRRKGFHLVQEGVKSVATERPLIDSMIETRVPVFVEDFSLEHSSSGGTISAVVIVTTSVDGQVPRLSST